MALPDKEKLHRIEDLKTKLFSRNYETHIEHHDHFSFENKKNISDSWDSNKENGFADKFFMKTSIFKKFFIFSIIFFILAIGYASYMFFLGGNSVSNKNIDIAILGNTFTAGGEDLSLIVEITNKNNSALELADLVVEYPKGASGGGSETEHIRESLGTIPVGAVLNENVKLVLFGEQGSVHQIKFSLEYRIEGSNAIFVKEKSYDVTINSTPINLSVDAPAEISPNQDFSINVKATQNATKATSKILLKVDYPLGFQFTKATPEPAYGNNIWNLGDLSPGAEKSISISGKMIDVFDGEEKVFRVSSGGESETNSSTIGVLLNSIDQIVLIKRPFIEARLYVNGNYAKEYTTDSKSPITGEIKWVNNLGTKVNDLQIRAKVSGNALNRKTINTQSGFYDSANDVIIWDKNYSNSLAEIDPGESGSVSFNFSSISLFSASGILSNPAISVDISISGKQALEGNQTEELKNSESKIIKLTSDVGFVNKALYYSGAFKNRGPIPPKVEQETTYTIVWTLSNTSNPISKAEVRSSLPPGVKYLGTVSPASENVTFDAVTKQIVWEVGKIARGASITGPGKEVSFQVSISPSLSQVNTSPVLINDAVLTGHDDFANVDVRVNRGSLNTKLTNDPDFLISGSRVVE